MEDPTQVSARLGDFVRLKADTPLEEGRFYLVIFLDCDGEVRYGQWVGGALPEDLVPLLYLPTPVNRLWFPDRFFSTLRASLSFFSGVYSKP